MFFFYWILFFDAGILWKHTEMVSADLLRTVKELHCPPKLEGNSMGFCDHLHTEQISDGRHF